MYTKTPCGATMLVTGQSGIGCTMPLHDTIPPHDNKLVALLLEFEILSAMEKTTVFGNILIECPDRLQS